jgi:hypothetical protein
MDVETYKRRITSTQPAIELFRKERIVPIINSSGRTLRMVFFGSIISLATLTGILYIFNHYGSGHFPETFTKKWKELELERFDRENWQVLDRHQKGKPAVISNPKVEDENN